MTKVSIFLGLLSALSGCTLVEPLGATKPDPDAGGSSNGGSSENGGTGAVTSGGGLPSGGANTTPDGGSAGGGSSSRAGSGGATRGGSPGTAGASGSAGSTGAYCTQAITPCGGSLIGTWSFQSSCVILPTDDPTVPEECQGSDAYQQYVLTGTLTFDTLSWTSSTTVYANETIKYTSSCISALNASNANYPAPPASTNTCAELASNQTGNGASSSMCPYNATNGGSCDCSLIFSSGPADSSDNYAVMQTGQYVNASDPAGYPVSYCVSGKTLTIAQTNEAGYTLQHVLTKK